MVLESFAKGEAPGSGAMPACIVLERWDYSLSDWNSKLQRQPDDVELKSALYMVGLLFQMFCVNWSRPHQPVYTFLMVCLPGHLRNTACW